MEKIVFYMLNFLKNMKSLFLAMFQEKIYWNVNISEFNSIDVNAKIYGPYYIKHVIVGKGTYIAPHSTITHSEIGSFCSIGPNFFCGWGIHPIDGISTSPAFYSTKKQVGFTYSNTDKIKERKLIAIGNDVFIGANVTVLDGVKIGDGAVIGAGSVVSKDIPPYAIAVGVPVKIIKYRFEDDVINNLLKIKWWENESLFKDVELYFHDINNFVLKYSKNV